MDTQHLKAFTTVARLESFTEAAEQLHLTQPAISKRISALEQQLNCKLFDRIGRGINLTEAGRALLPRAEHILRSVQDTELALSNLTGEICGSLRLATSHHIGLHHLPQVLKQFTQQYPQVELELDFMDSEAAYSAVLQGDVELAVITLSAQQPERISSHPLTRDPLSFVVATDHPLALNEEVSVEELSRFPAILPDPTMHTTHLVKELFEQHQCPLHISMATNYLETVKMMVSIGLGWSALPDTMLDAQLHRLNIKDAKLWRTLGSIHHRDRTLSNAANAFSRVLNLRTEPDHD